MSRFVQLNSVAHGPFDLRAEKIDGIIDAGDGGHTTIAFAGMQIAVTESREQILALLDAPAEVTAGFMDEVYDHLSNRCLWSMSPKTKVDLRAAIEAADRARGLRP